MEIGLIFEAVRALLSKDGAADINSTTGSSLAQGLKANLVCYRTLLRGTQFLELRVKLDSFKTGVHSTYLRPQLSHSTLALYADFTMEALALVAVLEDRMHSLHAADQQLASESSVPTAPRALLSIADQKTFHSLLEFVVAIGIIPYLLPCICKPGSSRDASIVKAVNVPWQVTTELLYGTCCVMLKCCDNVSIGSSVTMRHFSDILASLIQICYAPKPVVSQPSSDDHACKKISSPADIVSNSTLTNERSVKEQSMEMLQGLLTKTYQPLVVKELLVLQRLAGLGSIAALGSKGKRGGQRQGGVKWLGKVCGQMLSERLMSKSGVQHVISGIMDLTDGGMRDNSKPMDWRRCRSIATILARCPSQALSLESYYATICPQILCLVRAKSAGDYHRRVAIDTIVMMTSQNKCLSDVYLFQPLTSPLHHLQQGDCSVTTAGEVEACIYDLHKICTIVEPSCSLLVTLFPLSPIIFLIWKADIKNSPISDCAQVVLDKVLKAKSTAEIVRFLCFVCGIPCKEPSYFQTIHHGMQLLSAGQPPTLHIKQSLGVQDDALELEAMELNGQYVIKLLQTVLNVEESILGTFFMRCLNHLADILSAKDLSQGVHHTETDSSSVLLECEPLLPLSSHERISHTSALYVTAALCEHLSAEVISQVHLPSLLSACGQILTHHCKVLQGREGGRREGLLLTPCRSTYEEEVVGGTVSLSLVFGLLSAVMAGAREVDRADRHLLTAMLSSLQTLSTMCPDPELCQLAGDLHICIGTLGAVWSDSTQTQASNFMTGKTLHEMKEHLPQSREHTNPPHAGGSLEAGQDSKLSPFQEAVSQLQDQQIPVQGHALILLTHLLRAKDQETLHNSETLFSLFKQYLTHSDSYLYLASINGLVELALSTQPSAGNIISTLCQEYSCLAGEPNAKARAMYDQDTGQPLRSPSPPPSKLPAVETRMKIGEALVKICSELGDMLPHYLEEIVASLLTGVRDPEPLIRASSLSNLAVVCSSGRAVLSSVIVEVLSCVQPVLFGDGEVKVRQAALVVLKHVIKGTNLSCLQDDSLRDIYRLLKRVESSEEDELTRAHAQAALGELDKFMRAILFQDQCSSKLEKKISILSN